MLKRQNLPESWVGGIFDSHGTTVARTHNPEFYVGKKGGPILVRKMTEQREGAFEADTLEGISTYTVFSRSGVSNWTVAIGIPRAELESRLLASLLWTIAGTIVLLVLGLALARQFANRIRTSIRGLIPPATALARGEAAIAPQLQLDEAAEVASAIEDASRVLRDREEILAVVTHDLRNPLSAVSMLAAAGQKEGVNCIRNASRVRPPSWSRRRGACPAWSTTCWPSPSPIEAATC